MSFVVPLTFLFLFNSPKNALIIILSALIHEFGHFAMLLIFSDGVEKIDFSVFGVTIKKKRKLLSYQKEAAVLFAGPFLNLIFAYISSRAMIFCPTKANAVFFCANLFFGLINLLPIRNLDGGGILFALSALVFPLQTAEKVASAFSKIFGAFLVAAGIFVLIKTKINFSLLILAAALFSENKKTDCE